MSRKFSEKRSFAGDLSFSVILVQSNSLTSKRRPNKLIVAVRNIFVL